MSKKKTKPTSYTYQLKWLRNIVIFLSVFPAWIGAFWLAAYYRGADGFTPLVMFFVSMCLYLFLDATAYSTEKRHIHSSVLKALRPKK